MNRNNFHSAHYVGWVVRERDTAQVHIHEILNGGTKLGKEIVFMETLSRGAMRLARKLLSELEAQ